MIDKSTVVIATAQVVSASTNYESPWLDWTRKPAMTTRITAEHTLAVNSTRPAIIVQVADDIDGKNAVDVYRLSSDTAQNVLQPHVHRHRMTDLFTRIRVENPGNTSVTINAQADLVNRLG